MNGIPPCAPRALLQAITHSFTLIIAGHKNSVLLEGKGSYNESLGRVMTCDLHGTGARGYSFPVTFLPLVFVTNVCLLGVL